MGMKPINLIPAARREARRRAGRCRAWLGGLAACVAVSLTVSFGAGRLIGGGDRAVVESLERLGSQEADLLRQVALLNPELAEAQMQLEASLAVAVQPDWSILLALLSELRGPWIVLERCAVSPLTPTGASTSPAPAAAPSPAVVRTGAANPTGPARKPQRFRLEVQGMGRSHQDVSQFVLRLEQAQLFDQVTLLETRRDAFHNGQAVAFRIQCTTGSQEARR